MHPELNHFFKGLKIKVWEIFEDSIYYSFRYCLSINAKQLGKERLFISEPEGFLILENIPDRCAIIYECKCRGKGYTISRKDMLMYKDYIKKKAIEVDNKHHVPLTHFVIISSYFQGDYYDKIKELEKTGVNICLFPADYFKEFVEHIYRWEVEEIRAIDLTNIIQSGIVKKEYISCECNKIRQ